MVVKKYVDTSDLPCTKKQRARWCFSITLSCLKNIEGGNMNFESLPTFPVPEKISIKKVEGDTRVPYERVKSYDDKEFELLIREWVVSLQNRYQVRGFWGAGDKGRDVVAKDEGNHYLYYQCKHYDHPLTPSGMWSEFGKRRTKITKSQ